MEPRALPTEGSMMVMPSFFDFWGIQKIIKKSIRQKTTFFGYFSDFQDFTIDFLSILGSFLVPVGSFFRLFFWLQFCTQFLTFFWEKNENSKNEKVAFVSQNTVFREGRHVGKNARGA